MKTTTNILKSISLTALLGISVLTAMAQAPESFNYQAVIRDAAGEITSNSAMNVRFSIKEDSPSGTTTYREFVDLTSNEFGLINHAVGTGTVDLGTFEDISWSANGMFLQVEVSFNNGPYADLGTTQMVSVPYALEAKHATNAVSCGITGSAVVQLNNGGQQTVSIGLPEPIPASWVGEYNSVVLVTTAGGALGKVLRAYVTSTTSFEIEFDANSGGACRFNYLILPATYN